MIADVATSFPRFHVYFLCRSEFLVYQPVPKQGHVPSVPSSAAARAGDIPATPWDSLWCQRENNGPD